jgi:hypothetical protein
VFNQETPFLLFSPPISAFGADFRALNDTLQRTGVAIYDGLTLLDTLQPSTEPDITRFWGFSADAGELITEIRFTYIDNDVFGIDNIETVQVPEPATLLLVIGGLAGLVGLRRRW